MDEYEHLYKVLIIGDSCVGKTSMMTKMLGGQFESSFAATIGIDYRTKIININNKSIKVQLWDTAGQERFRSIVKTYFRAAMGILLCFDVSDRTTFNHLNDWYEIVQDYCLENVSIIVIGNKTDMQFRQVMSDEGFKYASSINAQYIELSTKNDDIQYLLYKIVQSIKDDNDVIFNETNHLELNDKNKNKKNCCYLM